MVVVKEAPSEGAVIVTEGAVLSIWYVPEVEVVDLWLHESFA